MVTFDSFCAYDREKDLMRFRCHSGLNVILCGVTRAALVEGVESKVSTLAELSKLYEARLEAIQRAVLHRLQRRGQSDESVLVIDVDDVYRLGKR